MQDRYGAFYIKNYKKKKVLLECAAAGRYTVQDCDITKLKPKTNPHLAMWVYRNRGDLYRTLPWRGAFGICGRCRFRTE